MPYKDPEKAREAKRLASARARARWQERDPEGYRAYQHAAQKKWRDSLTPEQRREIYQKRSEWEIRTGRRDPNAPSPTPSHQRRDTIPVKDNPDDPRHGTQNGYGNHKCRCDRCKEANTIYHRAYLARRAAREQQAGTH